MNKDKLRFKTLSLSELIEEESDFFPLLSQEDEDKIDKEKIRKETKEAIVKIRKERS